jgi:hypothetical protein
MILHPHETMWDAALAFTCGAEGAAHLAANLAGHAQCGPLLPQHCMPIFAVLLFAACTVTSMVVMYGCMLNSHEDRVVMHDSGSDQLRQECMPEALVDRVIN